MQKESTMNLQELLDMAERHARMIIFKKREGLRPTWLFWDGKDVFKVPSSWDGEFEKQVFKAVIREIIQEKKVIAYSFCTEAWVAKENKEEFERTGRPKVEPRHRPDRKEVMLVQATDGTTLHSRVWHIIRDWNERVTKLEPENMSNHYGFGGWMISLLGTPTNYV